MRGSIPRTVVGIGVIGGHGVLLTLVGRLCAPFLGCVAADSSTAATAIKRNVSYIVWLLLPPRNNHDFALNQFLLLHAARTVGVKYSTTLRAQHSACKSRQGAALECCRSTHKNSMN